MEFLLLTRFYLLRAYRAQAFFAWTIIALTACISIAAGVLVISFQQVQVQENELTELRQKNRVHAPAATGGRTAATEASNELPPFASGSFAEHFNSLAADAGVPIEELSYVLESEARQPYLRYRLTTAVKTGYPQIRKLVAVLANELPNVMLDAIRCTKENAMAEQLACELVFSAVFRKGTHGG